MGGGVGDFAGVELVGGFGRDRFRAGGRRGVIVESADAVLYLAVGEGDALAGAEVVEPGLHDEGFVEAVGSVTSRIDAPADGAVAETDAA